MINQYPLWKYLLLVFVLVIGLIYALPNVYGEDPALQISGTRNATIDATAKDKVISALATANIPVKAAELKPDQLLIRFNDTETQLKAVDFVKSALGTGYIVALNLAPATPDWLNSLNALPMYLGLDLRGGVHFLMEVDMKTALENAVERYSNDIRTLLRDERIRYAMIRA
ncbi:MAG: protein translocase subunit SecD, partial [Gammaproteobacteria bacterium]